MKARPLMRGPFCRIPSRNKAADKQSTSPAQELQLQFRTGILTRESWQALETSPNTCNAPSVPKVSIALSG